MYAKFKKCKFWLESITFLGHVISAEGIQVDCSKVTVVQEWKRATNVREIQSFLGLAGYYHQFVEEFSKIALPLTQLLRKENKFIW